MRSTPAIVTTDRINGRRAANPEAKRPALCSSSPGTCSGGSFPLAERANNTLGVSIPFARPGSYSSPRAIPAATRPISHLISSCGAGPRRTSAGSPRSTLLPSQSRILTAEWSRSDDRASVPAVSPFMPPQRRGERFVRHCNVGVLERAYEFPDLRSCGTDCFQCGHSCHLRPILFFIAPVLFSYSLVQFALMYIGFIAAMVGSMALMHLGGLKKTW